jgi:tRNA pseudouridine55 synthase
MAASEPGRRVDGILLVDKPAGMTSAAVVRHVKRRLGGVKVGHLGTLDPFATGLLPLALGEASKIVPFLNQEEKGYTGTIALGRTTNTLDSTGETTEEAPVPPLTPEAVERAAARFRGEIEQVPPMFSALKRGGRRLYDLARRGVEVERAPRKVFIRSLELSLLDDRTIALAVRSSKGTYVRSLARDVAAALGTVGHLSSLRRTHFGRYEVGRAIALDAVDPGIALPILSPREALAGVRELAASDALVAEVPRARARSRSSSTGGEPSSRCSRAAAARGGSRASSRRPTRRGPLDSVQNAPLVCFSKRHTPFALEKLASRRKQGRTEEGDIVTPQGSSEARSSRGPRQTRTPREIRKIRPPTAARVREFDQVRATREGGERRARSTDDRRPRRWHEAAIAPPERQDVAAAFASNRMIEASRT